MKNIWETQKEKIFAKATNNKLRHLKCIHDNDMTDPDELAYHVERFMHWNNICNRLGAQN